MPVPRLTDPFGQTPRMRYLKQFGTLDIEWLTWKPRLMDIMRYVHPGGGRFMQDEQNKGYRHDAWVVNDTAIDARKKLAAAMHTAMSSAAIWWFGLTTADSEPTETQRAYLHLVQAILFDILARSNFYTTIPSVYNDLIGPATSLMFIEEDDVDIVRFVHVPIGQYRLSVDSRGRVNRVFRLFYMTVYQVVERFCTNPDGTVDLSKLSSRVRNAWENNRIDEWVQVLHVVERRGKRGYGKIDKTNKPWASCWMEWSQPSTMPTSAAENNNVDNLGLLHEDGFDEQPFVAPRWAVIGEDSYGKDSPGWQCIGDIKGLQALELSSAKGIAKIIDPPMNAADGLKNASLLPGAVNYLSSDKTLQFTPAVLIPPELVKVAAEEKQRHEHRINRGFYADLLLMLANDESAQKDTAEAVRAKERERLLQLGGVFERIANEVFKILVHRLLSITQRKGLIPPPPPEMQGHTELNLEFQNSLVSAQKTLGITANDRLIASAANMAAAGRVDALDKLNVDAILDDNADKLGTNPKLLLTDEQVAQIRQQRAQAQQGAQQGEAMAKGAPALKQLSETDPEKLQQLLQVFGGNAQAQAGGLSQ